MVVLKSKPRMTSTVYLQLLILQVENVSQDKGTQEVSEEKTFIR